MHSSHDPLDATCQRPERVTELVFSGRQATHIHPHFLKMPNLECLWLDHNRLQTLHGIVDFGVQSRGSVIEKSKARGLFALKELHLDNNFLENLEDLRHIKFLTVLTLSNNRLRDLDETLHWIGHLKYLQHLDLFGNSITEESKYRLRVLWQFPKLEILDQHVVTSEERDQARRLYGLAKAAPVAFGKRITPDKVPQRVKDPLKPSKCEKMLFQRFKALQTAEKEEEERRLQADREALRKRREELDCAPIPKASAVSLQSEEEKLMRLVQEHFMVSDVNTIQGKFEEHSGAGGMLYLDEALLLLEDYGIYNIPVPEMGLIRRCTPGGDEGALTVLDFWRTILRSRFLCEKFSEWYRTQAREEHQKGGGGALTLAQRANKLAATAMECSRLDEEARNRLQHTVDKRGDFFETNVLRVDIDEAEEEENLRFSPPKKGWNIDTERYRRFQRSQKRPQLQKLSFSLTGAGRASSSGVAHSSGISPQVQFRSRTGGDRK